MKMARKPNAMQALATLLAAPLTVETSVKADVLDVAGLSALADESALAGIRAEAAQAAAGATGSFIAYGAALNANFGEAWIDCSKGDKSALGLRVEAERLRFVDKVGDKLAAASSWQAVKKGIKRAVAKAAVEAEAARKAALTEEELAEEAGEAAIAERSADDAFVVSTLKMLRALDVKVSALEAAPFAVQAVQAALAALIVAVKSGSRLDI
jgi:hypothetical protein